MPQPEQRDSGYVPGGDPGPNPDPEKPGGTAAMHHPPAEPQRSHSSGDGGGDHDHEQPDDGQVVE